MNEDIIKCKSTINISQLVDYYNLLESKYQEHKWYAKESGGAETYGSESVFYEMFGYAIRSKSTQPTKAKPAYHNIPKEFKGIESKDTELFFGIMKKLDEHFPYLYDPAILSHPPGMSAQLHKDTNLKLHIPIITNSKAYWLTENDKIKLKADGSIYFTNTYNTHGVINEGSETRVHLIIKIPEENLQDFLQQEVFITL